MRSSLASAIVLGLLLGAAGPAAAGGPTFIAEGGGGLMWGVSSQGGVAPGASANVLLGVGGRPAGSWLRYYFVIEAVRGGYQRTVEQNLRQIELDRALLEVGLGARVVAPLWPSLRWFADLELVGVNAATDFQGSHLLVDQGSTLGLGLRGATGLQLRPIEAFSASLRVGMTAAFSSFDDGIGGVWLTDVASESSHLEATLQVTVYF
jgi:hypothetical protein